MMEYALNRPLVTEIIYINHDDRWIIMVSKQILFLSFDCPLLGTALLLGRREREREREREGPRLRERERERPREEELKKRAKLNESKLRREVRRCNRVT